jgi:alpha-aminoadipic semialdehyde synthase
LSHTYASLGDARDSLRQIGKAISETGVGTGLGPILLVFTGNGNVSQGAQEIAKELPIEFIDPSQVASLSTNYDRSHSNSADPFIGQKIYGCIVEAKDYCIQKDGKPFSYELYSKSPEQFKSVFHEKFAPFATAIVNGIYWESRFPRLLTKENINALIENPKASLVTIADISCDIEVG